MESEGDGDEPCDKYYDVNCQGPNPSSMNYQLFNFGKTYLTSLCFTFLICKMGIPGQMCCQRLMFLW